MSIEDDSSEIVIKTKVVRRLLMKLRKWVLWKYFRNRILIARLVGIVSHIGCRRVQMVAEILQYVWRSDGMAAVGGSLSENYFHMHTHIIGAQLSIFLLKVYNTNSELIKINR